MKRNIVSASSTLRPRTASTTRRTLRGLIGISFATARTSTLILLGALSRVSRCTVTPLKRHLTHFRRLASRVPPEGAGGSELSQLVSNHVLADVDRHVAPPVVHGDGMPHELREDRGIARPGADDLALAGPVQRLQLGEELLVHKGTLLG